jgi:putative serine protease PepD
MTTIAPEHTDQEAPAEHSFDQPFPAFDPARRWPTFGSPQGDHLPPPPPPAPPVNEPPARRPRSRGPAVGLLAVALLAGSAGGMLDRFVLGSSAKTVTTAAAPGAILAPDATLTVGQIVAKVEPSVVSITASVAGARGTTGTAAGTGIILTPDGQVVTNAHVVAGGTNVLVTLAGQTKALPATILGTNTAADLALLKITGASGLTPAQLGQSSAVRVGDDAIAIGNALALPGGPTVTRGIVSGLNRSVSDTTGTITGLLQTDAAISSGNSGGPLVNAAGQVIGINTAGATSSRTTLAENIGFAIAIDTAKPIIAQLGGTVLTAANTSAPALP